MKSKLVVVILAAALILSACASRAGSSDTVLVEKGGYAAPQADYARSAPAAEAPAPVNPAGGSSGSFGNASANPAPQKQMIIMNGDMVIVVDNPAAAQEKINQIAIDLGGNLLGSQLYKTTNYAGVEVQEGYVSINVPSEKLQEAIRLIKSLVKDEKKDIISENLNSQNVTSQYVDLQSRLRNLEETEAQLRKILETASKVDDVLSVFNRLTEVREQIEITKGQMKYYEEASAMSTLNITLRAREMVEPITVAGWTPTGVARDALQALLDGLKFLASALIWIIIFVAPIAILLYLFVRLVIWIIRKLFPRRAKPMPPFPPIPPVPPAA